MVLEDLHWADEGTIDALVYVARRIDRAPALIIGTYRGDIDPTHPLQSALGLFATAPRVERLSLRPLSLEAVRSLADSAGRDGDVVFATTRGNPFFVGELLASAPGEVPATVRDAVLGRYPSWTPRRRHCSSLCRSRGRRLSFGCSTRSPSRAATRSSGV